MNVCQTSRLSFWISGCRSLRLCHVVAASLLMRWHRFQHLLLGTLLLFVAVLIGLHAAPSQRSLCSLYHLVWVMIGELLNKEGWIIIESWMINA